MQDKHPIDEFFRAGFDGKRATAPASAWAGVSSQLAAGQRYGRMVWLRWSAMAGFMLLLGAGTTWVGLQNTSGFGEEATVAGPVLGNAPSVNVAEANIPPASNESVPAISFPDSKAPITESVKPARVQPRRVSVQNQLASVTIPPAQLRETDSVDPDAIGGNGRPMASLSGILGGSNTTIASSEPVQNQTVPGAIASVENGQIIRGLNMNSGQIPVSRVMVEGNYMEIPAERDLANLEFQDQFESDWQKRYDRATRGDAWKDGPLWVIGGYYAPEMVEADQKILSTTSFEDYYQENSRVVDVIEYGTVNNPTTSFSAGADVGYRMGRRWVTSLGFGIQDWSGTGKTITEVHEEALVRGVKPVVSSGTGGIDVLVHFNETLEEVNRDTTLFDYQNRFLEVPLNLRYLANLGRFRVSFNSGISGTLLWKRQYQTTFTSASPEMQVQRNKTYGGAELQQLNLLLSSTLELPVSQNGPLAFRFEPYFRHGILLRDEAVLRRNSSSLGLRIGLNYYL